MYVVFFAGGTAGSPNEGEGALIHPLRNGGVKVASLRSAPVSLATAGRVPSAARESPGPLVIPLPPGIVRDAA